MPYEVTLSEDEQLIEVSSHGDVSLIDIRNAVELISKLQEESGVTDVLSDATGQRRHAVTLDIAGVASRLPTGLRIAAILDQDQPTKSDVNLMARLLKSRGSTSRTFSSREEALQWLRGPNRKSHRGLSSR